MTTEATERDLVTEVEEPWEVLAVDNPSALWKKHVHCCPNCGFFFECLEDECKDDYSACCGDCE